MNQTALSIRPLALLLALLCLTHCQVYDQGYRELQAVPAGQARADDIVGMWHRNSDDQEWKWRMSLLFHRDGTGIADSYRRDEGVFGGETEDFDDMKQFKWSYTGNGTWLLESVKRPGYKETCRIANGKLLRPWRNTWFCVYERVEH